MISINLTNKRALVTGAGSGIGREIALTLGRAGADVALHYFDNEDTACSALDSIVLLGRKAVMLQADLSDMQQIKGLVASVIDQLGGIDILVNNAGITWNREFDKVTPEQFDRIYAVNVRAPFFLTQMCLSSLLDAHGSIVNISSIHALEGYPHHSVYSGTKGALVAWTRQLAIELAPKGVRVNAIAPGSVAVESYLKIDPRFDPLKAGAGIPCGFIGLPRDIASVTAFLASDLARYIVGQTIVVDGGTTSWMPFGEQFRESPGGQFGRDYVPEAL